MGTALHDRFMLPDIIKRDLREVLARLRLSGYNVKDEWFDSHFEFRFPKIGSVAAEGIELELRQALEPWNVIAEETYSARTVRTVDSSMERMQVKVSGSQWNPATLLPATDARCRFNQPAKRAQRWAV